MLDNRAHPWLGGEAAAAGREPGGRSRCWPAPTPPCPARRHLLLPAASWAETEGTYTSSTGRVQLARRAFLPGGQARPAWEVLFSLGVALGVEQARTVSPRALFDELAAEVPAFAGSSYRRLASEGGIPARGGGARCGLTLAVIGIKLAAVFGVLLTTVPIMVWVERRGSALIQDRLGPNRVGPFGLLQPVVDAVKLIIKENLIPSGVNPFLYILAPAIALTVALSTFIAVPFGKDSGLELFGQQVHGFIVAPDLNIGVLYIFAIASLAVYSTGPRRLGVEQQVLPVRRHPRRRPGHLLRARHDRSRWSAC